MVDQIKLLGIATLIFMAIELQQSGVNAKFELKVTLHTYQNANHTLGIAPNIRCCRSQNESPTSCTSSCQNRFIFCVRDMQSFAVTQDIRDTCTYGAFTTRSYSDDMIIFEMGKNAIELSRSSSQSSAPNPLEYTGDTWPGTAEFVIEVTNRVSGDQDMHIDTIIVDLPSLMSSGSSTPATTHTGIFGHSMINVNFHLSCLRNYFGSNCSIFCDPRNDDRGHYDCTQEGNIVCRQGYTNESTNCVQCVPLTNCSSIGGYCNNPGECICRPGYTGSLCEIDLDPCGHQEPCLNDEICTNTTPNMYDCSCPKGFVGENCLRKTPNKCKIGICMNGGTCVDGVCSCPETYTGALCEQDLGALNDTQLIIILSTTLSLILAVVIVIVITLLYCVCRVIRRNQVPKMRSMNLDVPAPTDSIELHRNNSYAYLVSQGVDMPYYSVIHHQSNTKDLTGSASLKSQLASEHYSDPQYYVNEGLGPQPTSASTTVCLPNIRS